MSNSESDSESKMSKIRFDPPVFVQRYNAAVDILADEQVYKVVDFGCNNMTFLSHLKKIDKLTSILAVDYDYEILSRFQYVAEPIIYNTICSRKSPLNITVLHGSVSDPDYRLIGCDAVVAIELIEHLDPGALDRLPHNIFGFIKPHFAIITTPNADFNVLFGPMKYGQFRHPDHRFEWSREQFEDWSNNIALRYPDYEVTFKGIGAGPVGTEHLGCCSQLALFVNKNYEKKSDIELDLNIDNGDKRINGNNLWDWINWPDDDQPQQYYETIASYDYPFYVDPRTELQIILDEIQYAITSYLTHEDSPYYDVESDAFKIPINRVLPISSEHNTDIDKLRNILTTNGYNVKENYLILYKDLDTKSEDSEYSNNSFENDVHETNNDAEKCEEEWGTEEDPVIWGD